MQNDFNSNPQTTDLSDEFASLLNSYQEQAQPEEQQLPPSIGDIPIDKFESLLVEATGGSINNYSQFQEAITAKDKYAELQEKLGYLENQLTEYQGGPKYSNELVQKLDEMYRNGIPEDNIQEFIKLQRMNIDEISDKDVMKMVYSKEYPGLKEDELEQLLEDEYGDLDGIGGVKIKKAAIEGRKKLQQMKVNLQEPEALRMQKAAEAEAEKTFNNWHKVVNTIMNKPQHEFKIDLGGKESVLNFSLPEAAREKINVEIAKYATMYKIPPTKEGMAHLNDFAERTLLFQYGKDIIATFMRNVAANVRMEELAKVHNIELVRRADGKETKVQSKKTPYEQQMDRLAREGMEGKWR